MVDAQTRIPPRKKKKTEKINWDFEVQTDHLNPVRIPKKGRLKQGKNWCIADSIVLEKQILKMKESLKMNKYLDLVRQLEKKIGVM